MTNDEYVGIVMHASGRGLYRTCSHTILAKAIDDLAMQFTVNFFLETCDTGTDDGHFKRELQNMKCTLSELEKVWTHGEMQYVIYKLT